jgi:hypothetical protein
MTTDVKWFAFVDWASRKHQLCLLDADGRLIGQQAFAHSGAGLAQACDWLLTKSGGRPAEIAVGIEVCHGPVVETLLERGFAVYALNPRQLDRFRDRFTVAGVKAAYQSGDYPTAFAEFQDLANGGDTQAMLWLGFLYQEGQGTVQDYNEAMNRFRMAADLGDAQAAFYVGNMYANGYGVTKNAIEAVRWFRQSAEHGDVFGEFALGQAHEHRDGAPRDLRAARRWYQAAADQGSTDAQAALQHLTVNPE